MPVRDDRRYYGRGAKGNRRLSEQEIALLYAQRQRREVDLARRLEEVVRTTPYVSQDPDAGRVYAFAQPVPLDQGLWDAAAANAGGVDGLQQRLGEAARSITTAVEFDPSFRGLAHWHRVGADAWRMSSQPEEPPRSDLLEYLSDITFNIDGRSVLFAGNATHRVHENANDTTGRKYLFERTIAGNLAAFFAAMRILLQQAGYFGAVDLGVAVTNLEGAVSVGRHENSTSPFIVWRDVPTYNASTFTRTRRLSAALELQDAEAIALSLVGRLLAATTGRDDYNPFLQVAGGA